ncbi:MAG: DNA-3-methyladenine glycosylase 2 family protein [Theionarchaea archaeon]|nr:DNA-3-methyladenine glycosylase 2 family protein [Theionarchaea archaeon]MBU7041080.1 DNA-3-methyladenine glycosylase 2 family protein [Theionarchaea archaeon]
MHTIHLSQPLNLYHTLNSGQVFRWHNRNGTWEGIVRGEFIRLFENDGIHCTCDEDFLIWYFRLDDDLDTILSTIDKDIHIHRATTVLHGLRLIRQDPWECLISFICSSFNNVARIKQIVEKLCRAFGAPLPSCRGYEFPSPETLADAPVEVLRKCGLGYRDVYVQKTAQALVDGFPLYELRKMPYLEAKKALLQLPGVGHKVADCVLLFSLDNLEAFPCDTHVRSCITQLYNPTIDVSTFGRQYFGPYAGYANHYLFHYQRSHNTW